MSEPNYRGLLALVRSLAWIGYADGRQESDWTAALAEILKVTKDIGNDPPRGSSADPEVFLLKRSEELKVIEWMHQDWVQALIKQGADFSLTFHKQPDGSVTVKASVSLNGHHISEDLLNYRSDD